MSKGFSALGAIVAAFIFAVGCGSSNSTPAQDGGSADGGATDGGGALITANVTADPAQGTASQQTTFTAAISGGNAPYTCNWVYSAGGSSETGSVTGSTCTGTHTYTQDGNFVVTVNINDSRNHFGSAFMQYTVGADGGSVGGTPNLRIQPGSLILVDAPSPARYAPGAQIKVDFKVENIGNGAAVASVARVRLKNTATDAETALTPDVSVPEISAGGNSGTTHYIGNIPQGQALGPYDVIVRVNATSTVDEGAGGDANNEDHASMGITADGGA